MIVNALATYRLFVAKQMQRTTDNKGIRKLRSLRLNSTPALNSVRPRLFLLPVLLILLKRRPFVKNRGLRNGDKARINAKNRR